MYERKPEGAFALSETSFIIFLLMASRRLDSDPYLNQNLNEKFYTEIGLKHLDETEGLFDLLDRHYPDLAKDFKGKDGKKKQSAFKPTLGQEDWTKAIEKGVVPESVTKVWKNTKEANDQFFDDIEQESKNYYKNLKSNGSPPFSPQNVYILISVLLFVIPVILHQFFSDNETLRQIGIRKLWPVSMDVAKELGYSNNRHVDDFLRVSDTISVQPQLYLICASLFSPVPSSSIVQLYHLPTNPLIFISQTYLMDQTFTLFTIPLLGIKVNFGGLYFVALTVYGLIADLQTGAVCAVWFFVFYKLATSGKFDEWLTRLVGDDSKLRTAFFMYCFCQFSQIIVHNIFENYYDWNLFQVRLCGYLLSSQLFHLPLQSFFLPMYIVTTAFHHPAAYYCLQHYRCHWYFPRLQ